MGGYYQVLAKQTNYLLKCEKKSLFWSLSVYH